MARFGNIAELATFPGKLDADYAEYAPALWQKGIKTPQQLANFIEPHYLACDVPEGHIDDIKARADTTGELLACNTLCMHTYWNVGNTLCKHTCGVGNPVRMGLQLVAQLLRLSIIQKENVFRQQLQVLAPKDSWVIAFVNAFSQDQQCMPSILDFVACNEYG